MDHNALNISLTSNQVVDLVYRMQKESFLKKIVTRFDIKTNIGRFIYSYSQFLILKPISMNPKQIQIGRIEQEMFKDFNIHPNKNYRCGVLLDAGLIMYFNCSTDDNCKIINVSMGIDFPFPELNFHAISEIKDEDGNLVKRV